MCALQLLQYDGQLQSQSQNFLVDARCSFSPVSVEAWESLYVWNIRKGNPKSILYLRWYMTIYLWQIKIHRWDE
jgi:hypothetical protein